MHADVERFSDQPDKHFVRVVHQQGRVSLAADANEQTEILLRYLANLARDVIGPHGTPTADDLTKPGGGFEIVADASGFTIGAGHYWVDGLLCDNTVKSAFKGQPSSFPDVKLPEGQGLAYLDVWERHVASAEDGTIRDVALGGPDTCSRSQLVWQVKVLPIDPPVAMAGLVGRKQRDDKWEEWGALLARRPRARLAAKVERDSAPTDPCQVPPGAGYFGNENQLYRVEIHRESGQDENGQAIVPTFKWSRDNGSVAYPLLWVEGSTAVLRDPPVDCRKALATGALVEVVDKRSSLLGLPGPLRRVVGVDDDGDDMVVHLDGAPVPRIDAVSGRHPMLRRWDHPAGAAAAGVPTTSSDGALTVTEDGWLALEDGIQIRFAKMATPAIYRTGDYWTFPARAATAEITWPADAQGKPADVETHGITHHYAPLAVVTVSGGAVNGIQDFRNGFAPLASLPL